MPRGHRLWVWTVGVPLVVGSSVLVVMCSDRPAWFSVAGPLNPPSVEPRAFGPNYWKRGCLGITWAEERANGSWLACAGIPTGPRLEALNLGDEQPWTVPRVTIAMDPLTLAGEMRAAAYQSAAILAWRRTEPVDDVLLVGETRAGRWMLSRTCLPRGDRGGARAGHPDLGARGLERWDLSHRPTEDDLARFTRASAWDVTRTQLPVKIWGVDPEAWARVTRQPAGRALEQEIARLRSYVSPVGNVEKRYAAEEDDLSSFELAPGRSVVLPESRAADVQRQCSRADLPDFEATWDPTARDIRELEKRLPKLNAKLHRLLSGLDPCGAVRLSVNDYHRQYSGLVIGGRRVIYVNALSGTVGSDWRTEPFVICDGGPSAWGASYDVEDQCFSPVTCNGFA